MSTNPEPEVSAAPPTGMPVGSVAMFAGVLNAHSTAELFKQGWFPCDGARLEARDYPELHGVIRNSHGGDGNHFFLPDLRGRFVRGVDAGARRDPDVSARVEAAPGGNKGDHVGSLQRDAFRAHSHDVPHLPTGLHWAVDELHTYEVAKWNKDSGTTDNTGGNETRPLNLSLNFIIRFRQI